MKLHIALQDPSEINGLAILLGLDLGLRDLVALGQHAILRKGQVAGFLDLCENLLCVVIVTRKQVLASDLSLSIRQHFVFAPVLFVLRYLSFRMNYKLD